MEEKAKPQEVKIKLGEITLPKIDLTPYVGKKEIVEKVSILKGKGFQGKGDSYYIRMETSVIDVLQKGKEPSELRASRIFGIQQDEEGNFGWGKDTKLGLFLASKRIKHPDEMKGKEVMIQLTEDEKFLTFI